MNYAKTHALTVFAAFWFCVAIGCDVLQELIIYDETHPLSEFLLFIIDVDCVRYGALLSMTSLAAFDLTLGWNSLEWRLGRASWLLVVSWFFTVSELTLVENSRTGWGFTSGEWTYGALIEFFGTFAGVALFSSILALRGYRFHRYGRTETSNQEPCSIEPPRPPISLWGMLVWLGVFSVGFGLFRLGWGIIMWDIAFELVDAVDPTWYAVGNIIIAMGAVQMLWRSRWNWLWPALVAVIAYVVTIPQMNSIETPIWEWGFLYENLDALIWYNVCFGVQICGVFAVLRLMNIRLSRTEPNRN